MRRRRTRTGWRPASWMTRGSRGRTGPCTSGTGRVPGLQKFRNAADNFGHIAEADKSSISQTILKEDQNYWSK